MQSDCNCPICNGNEARKAWVLVAPFIRVYALDPMSPRTSQLRECKDCGHRFFRERFTNQELGRLYQDYRDENYLNVRQSWEPWYSQAVNSANLMPEVIASRQASLRELLKRVGWKSNERRVTVDIGGDAGQCIPLDYTNGAYVLEASTRETVEGVNRIQRIEDLPKPAGLLLCLHVLEHLPEPVGFLHKLLSDCALTNDALVVIEVPLERVNLGPGLYKNWYLFWLKKITSIRWLVIFLDGLSTLTRAKFNWLTAPLFLKLHEHMHFFSAKSLRETALKAGIDVIWEETSLSSMLGTHQGVLRLVAQTRQAKP